MRLEKYQRNAIFEALVAGGLDPNECDLTEGSADVRISHGPSGSYFILGGSALLYKGSYVVGDSTLAWPYEANIWMQVPDRVQRWAEDVKRDVDTPDLWAELQREREIFVGTRYAAVENTPFTSDEQVEIRDQLRRIREVAKTTYSLSDSEMLSVEARLDYLEAAAGRLGRTDWRGVFVGVILTVIVGGLLPPEAVHNVFVTALMGLEHLFGGGSPLAPGQLPRAT